MPEEAKVVELLQMMNRRPAPPRPRKLAVLVSGWDAVQSVNDAALPDTWMAANRPMVEQFLRYNADLWTCRFYGVSAQGGVLPRDKEQLVAMRKPSERIRIAGHGASAHDLTSPIRWLMATGAA
jgi:hypothetical protein